jgi:hypothetical protein
MDENTMPTEADQAEIVELKRRLAERTTELKEGRAQQAAAAEVLKIISSSKGELAPVFQAILKNAIRICEAKFGHLVLVDGDLCRVAAEADMPRPPMCSRSSAARRSISRRCCIPWLNRQHGYAARIKARSRARKTGNSIASRASVIRASLWTTSGTFPLRWIAARHRDALCSQATWFTLQTCWRTPNTRSMRRSGLAVFAPASVCRCCAKASRLGCCP